MPRYCPIPFCGGTLRKVYGEIWCTNGHDGVRLLDAQLQALLPDCHPHDQQSVQEMIDSITNGMRWDVGEMEATCRQAERSTRKDKSPVTAEEADRLRNELFDTRNFTR